MNAAKGWLRSVPLKPPKGISPYDHASLACDLAASRLSNTPRLFPLAPRHTSIEPFQCERIAFPREIFVQGVLEDLIAEDLISGCYAREQSHRRPEL